MSLVRFEWQEKDYDVRNGKPVEKFVQRVVWVNPLQVCSLSEVREGVTRIVMVNDVSLSVELPAISVASALGGWNEAPTKRRILHEPFMADGVGVRLNPAYDSGNVTVDYEAGTATL